MTTRNSKCCADEGFFVGLGFWFFFFSSLAVQYGLLDFQGQHARRVCSTGWQLSGFLLPVLWVWAVPGGNGKGKGEAGGLGRA